MGLRLGLGFGVRISSTIYGTVAPPPSPFGREIRL